MFRRSKIFKFESFALAASASLMPFASVTHATPAPAAVTIANFTFKSPVLTVKPGTTVTWTNGDDIPHTIVSTNGMFKSKVLDSGDKYSFTFAKPGQFGYYCSIHPHMTGMIVVKA